MARPLRINHAGGWYHVMNRGIDRRAIFLEDGDRRHFIELVGELLERFEVETHAFCLMDNHYHLALRTPLANLSGAMKWLGQSYSSWFNRRHHRVGPLFQGRYKSLPVDADEWLWELILYIHLNPVRTSAFGLDKHRSKDEAMGAIASPSPEEVSLRLRTLRHYAWSSLRGYAGYAKAPKWLYTSHILEALGKEAKDQRKRYREMVKDQLRRGVQETSFEHFKDEVAIGSAEFVEKIKQSIAKNNTREIQSKRRLRTYISFDRIINTVEQVKGEPMDAWFHRHGDWGKWILLFLGHRHCGLTQIELGQKVGGMDYAAVSAGIRRLEQSIRNNKKLKRELQKYLRILNIET
jgi:putative transposase